MKKKLLFLMLALVGLFVGANVGIAAEKTTSPFTGVTVQAGDEFYLYNVESGRWLQGNNRTEGRYTTSAELGFEGMDLKLIANGSGWQIDPKFGHNHSINGNGDDDLYMDTGRDVTVWTFESVTMDGVSNAYRIKIGDKFLHATPENEDFKLIINTNEVRATWQIVTKEERIYYARQNATSSNPVDMSFLIRGNEFADQDERVTANWSVNGSESDNGGINWSNGGFDGGNLFNRVFEAWDLTKLHLSQTISGLPAGYYEVEAHASESPTGNGGFTEDLLNQYNAGTLAQYGTFYAGDKSEKLPSVYSQQYNEKTGHFAARQLGSKWVIDGINQISYAMAHKDDAYKVVLSNVRLNNDGDLTIGIKVTEAPNKTIWVAADKFRLRYLGSKRSISSAEDLESFAAEVNGGRTGLNAELTADIDMSGKTHTSIGTSENKYEGLFDGKGHVIKNLSLSANSGSGVGFFGYTNGAIIQDVEFLKAKVNVTGGNNTGIVVGICDGGTIIQRCAVVNSYISGNDHTGSIAGCAKGNSTITNCYSNAKVTSVYQAGGLVGTSEGMTLDHCIFMGPSIEGTYPDHGGARGLISLLEGGSTTMKHNVVATQYVYSGGGSGYCQSLVSQNGNTLVVDDNYSWGSTRYGNDSSNQTYGLNSNDVNGYQIAPWDVNQAFFEARGFDLTNDWKMVEGFTYAGGSYPVLRWMSAPASPVEIGTKEELIDFSTFMWDNQGVTLTNDIDLTGETYIPIGNEFRSYNGTFNGQGHVVTLAITSDKEYQGLIGRAKGGAVIQNVITRGSVAGPSRCGGILGGSKDASGTITLTNCGNEASVTVAGQNAAGIVGCNSGGSAIYNLTNCYNAGTIEGGSESAGISGWLGSGATVTNCYNIGSVTGDQDGRTFTRSDGDGCDHINCYSSLNVNHYSGVITTNYSIDKVHSGELCVALGNAFTQDLSQADSHPTFGSATVGRGQWFSDDYIYYNVDGSGNITVNQLNLDETKTAYNVPVNVTAKNVSMTRTLKAGVWNTFCSPVAIAKSNFSAAKELTGVTANGNNYSMAFTEVAGDVLEAGKPYMVQVSEGKSSLTASNVPVAAAGTSTSSETFNGLTFTGNFTNGNAPQGSFIISSNVFYKVDSAVALKAFRGYITVSSGGNVKALDFTFEDDDATAIEMVNSQWSMVNDQPIYNVAGQRISKMQKGINIVNGKKVMVK